MLLRKKVKDLPKSVNALADQIEPTYHTFPTPDLEWSESFPSDNKQISLPYANQFVISF